MSPLPLANGHGRAAARCAVDLHLVHQAPRAGQAHPRPAAGGEAVAHRLIDVGDARAVIGHDDLDARLLPGGATLADDDSPVPVGGVAHDVARQLGDGGGDAALIDDAEPEPPRHFAGRLTRGHDVASPRYWELRSATRDAPRGLSARSSGAAAPGPSRVEGRAHALQLQAELDERDRDGGLDADHDGLRAEQPGAQGDVVQHPAEEGVHDLHHRHVQQHAARARAL